MTEREAESGAEGLVREELEEINVTLGRWKLAPDVGLAFEPSRLTPGAIGAILGLLLSLLCTLFAWTITRAWWAFLTPVVLMAVGAVVGIMVRGRFRFSVDIIAKRIACRVGGQVRHWELDETWDVGRETDDAIRLAPYGGAGAPIHCTRGRVHLRSDHHGVVFHFIGGLGTDRVRFEGDLKRALGLD